LTGRQNRELQIERFAGPRIGQTRIKYRRPFWLPASNYYVLTTAVTITLFFIFWEILHDQNEDTPWIPSGIAASVVLIIAVFLREVILRKARVRYLLNQKQLDANLKSVSSQLGAAQIFNKLTVEQNAAVINGIQKKSEAAKILNKLSEGHLEVFEMCNEYIALNRQQMETVGVGSPRLAALLRGKEVVRELHHYHLLTWAQNETRSLTQESKIRATMSEKLESAQRALIILTSALEFYPNDRQLLESEAVLKEFIISIKVSHSIEQGERSAFKGNYKRAISHYRDALFCMARENIQNDERNSVAQKINKEIENLNHILSTKAKTGLKEKPSKNKEQ
jgi:tetratricopeptide (TPR) repeat protein